METILFPRAVHLSFVSKPGRCFAKEFAAKSLHSFKVEPYGLNSVKLTAANGNFAPGVDCSYFERLPTGYVWAKFKETRVLSTAKRGASWNWQPETATFEAGGVYAIKMLPPDDGQTDSCNFQTKNRKIFPYVDRGYFSVVSENSRPALPKVLEAFPLPIPGVRRDHDPDCWDAPTEYDSIPVITDGLPSYSFRHPTVKPVAALRLDFDVDCNPIYRCSYFGPALK